MKAEAEDGEGKGEGEGEGAARERRRQRQAASRVFINGARGRLKRGETDTGVEYAQ